MEELLEFVNQNDNLIVSDNINGIKTIRWEIGRVSFYLHTKKREVGHYDCGGAIILTRNGIDKLEVITVSKPFCSEKGVIKLLEDMISSSIDLNSFIENKSDYLNG